MQRGVKIIECLDKDDPGSEGRCLKHIFNLMEIKSSYSHVGSIDELLHAIAESKYQYIHISAHGDIGAGNKFKGCGGHRKESAPKPTWCSPTER